MENSIDTIRLAFSPASLMVLNVILGILMFGVALDIKVSDFRRIAKNPRGPLVGIAAQFVLLPALTFLLTLILDPHPTVALGMILVAACPGGNISNFMTYLARGNAALSVGMTAVSSTAAIVMTPLNIAFWGGLNPKTASLLKAIALDPLDMFGMVLVILGVPLAAGMIVGARYPKITAKVRKPLRIVGATIFMAFVVIGLKNNFEHFSGSLAPVFAAIILHNAMSLSLGYGAARLMRLPAYDARAISIEVGIQNSGLGLVLIFNFFGGIGGMAVVAAGWGVWHIIAGLTLSRIWSGRPIDLPALRSAPHLEAL
jgi:BASS family bile acid:Na+ symporter